MTNVPNPPTEVTVTEWQRAVALTAATTMHAEKGGSYVNSGAVVETAKRFESFLQTGN